VGDNDASPAILEGLSRGTAGRSRGVYLSGSDTAKLSPGWHTVIIDYLGSGKYAPCEFKAPFWVVNPGPQLRRYDINRSQVQTDSSASAQADLPTAVGIAQNYGFSGSYTDSQTWPGSMIGSSGAPMDAMVGSSAETAF